MASDTSDQRNHSSWSGRAVRFAPVTLCLSAQGLQHDRSDDHATPDGLKHFRLSQAWISDRARFGRSLPGVHQAKGGPDAPTGVSGHRGFRSASHLGGYGTLLISRRY
jgi:hypothetical protein